MPLARFHNLILDLVAERIANVVTRRRSTPTGKNHHKSTTVPNGSAEQLKCAVPVSNGWAWPTRCTLLRAASGRNWQHAMLSSRLTRCIDQTVEMARI